jgi:hypothetical protein
MAAIMATTVVTIETPCIMIKAARHQKSSPFGGSMRSSWCWTLLPLGALAGCGPGSRTTPVEAPPHARDLTTPQTASSPVQVISSQEVIRADPARRSKPRVPRQVGTETVAPPVSTAAVAVPTVVAPVRLNPTPLATPVAWKGGAASLEPGQTVTIVPAASGPSPEPDAGPAPATERRGGGVRVGGGGCHPRGGRGGGSVFRLIR